MAATLVGIAMEVTLEGKDHLQYMYNVNGAKNGFSEVILVYALVSVNLHKYVVWRLPSILFVVYLLSAVFGAYVN